MPGGGPGTGRGRVHSAPWPPGGWRGPAGGRREELGPAPQHAGAAASGLPARAPRGPAGGLLGKRSRLTAHPGFVLGTPDSPRDGEMSHAGVRSLQVSLAGAPLPLGSAPSCVRQPATGPAPAGRPPPSLPGVVGPLGDACWSRGSRQAWRGQQLSTALRPGPSQPGDGPPVPAGRTSLPPATSVPWATLLSSPFLGQVGPAPGRALRSGRRSRLGARGPTAPWPGSGRHPPAAAFTGRTPRPGWGAGPTWQRACIAGGGGGNQIPTPPRHQLKSQETESQKVLTKHFKPCLEHRCLKQAHAGENAKPRTVPAP